MGISLECVNVEFTIGKTPILRDVSLGISAGQFFGIVGPSGAGKTTLLRLLAGLDGLKGGSIYFYDSNGQVIQQAKNNVALLFQSLALWPHVTVRQHVELVLPSASGEKRFDEVLHECGIPESLWPRYPHQLSGGELQRVALARALASQPMLLLVDEPLVNVDQLLRSQIQSLLKNIQVKYGTTIVYVTHQWEEITALCESVCVLDRGRVIQQGPVDRVYWNPVNRRCAKVTGAVVDISAALLESGRISAEDKTVERAIRILEAVRPQQLDFIEPQGSNSWSVFAVYPSGFDWCYQLRSAQDTITFKSSRRLGVGDVVGIAIRKSPSIAG